MVPPVSLREAFTELRPDYRCVIWQGVFTGCHKVHAVYVPEYTDQVRCWAVCVHVLQSQRYGGVERQFIMCLHAQILDGQNLYAPLSYGFLKLKKIVYLKTPDNKNSETCDITDLGDQIKVWQRNDSLA